MSKDKPDWGPGPWQHEPDKTEWVDKETGLECKVLRGPWGAFCGYVGVSKNHPAYGMGYDPYVGEYVDENIEWWRRHITHRVEYKIRDISIHGGLTFAGPFPDSDAHWFGFDCSHSIDYMPGLHTDYASLNGVYRTIEYVHNQVTSLAKQLVAIKREDYEQTGAG